MVRFLASAALALSIGGSLLAGATASAASPSQRECEAAGGEFYRDHGEAICIITEEGKNPRFESEQTITGQGNLGNKTEYDEECTGTGSGKCPPGQFNEHRRNPGNARCGSLLNGGSHPIFQR